MFFSGLSMPSFGKFMDSSLVGQDLYSLVDWAKLPKEKGWLLSMSAVRVKKAQLMDSPVFAQVQMQQIFLVLHHCWISSTAIFLPRSFLFPRTRQFAVGARLNAISYHTFLRFSQEDGSLMSNTSTTPWQDLKQVATIDLNFSCPAVSQMHSLTDRSWSLTDLQRKSMAMVVGCSWMDQFSMYLQKMEVLPTFESPTKMILYFWSVKLNARKLIQYDYDLVKQLLINLLMPISIPVQKQLHISFKRRYNQSTLKISSGFSLSQSVAEEVPRDPQEMTSIRLLKPPQFQMTIPTRILSLLFPSSFPPHSQIVRLFLAIQ